MQTTTSPFGPAPLRRIAPSLGVLFAAYAILAVLALLFQVGPFVPLAAVIGLVLLGWSAASLRFGLTASVVTACLVPIGLAFHVGPFTLTIGRLVGFAFVAGWLAALSRRDGPLRRRTRIDVAVALFAFAFLLSMTVNMPLFGGPEFGESAEQTARIGVDFLLFFFAAASVLGAGRQHLDRVLRTIALVVAGIAALGIVDWVTNQNVFAFLAPVLPGDLAAQVRAVSETVVHERGGVRRAVGTFQGPNQLGAAVVLVLPLLVHYASAPGRYRRLYLAGAAVATLSGVLTVSRSVFVSLAVVVLVYLAASRSLKLGWSGVGAILLVITVAFVANEQIRTTVAVYFEGLFGQQESSVQSRVKDYDNVLRQFDRSPLAGSGPATWSEQALSRPDNGKIDPTDRGQVVLDNEYLSTLAERGAIGLLGQAGLLLGAIAIGIRGVTTARDRVERSLRAALLASLSAYLALCAFFTVSAFYAASKLYFLLVAATMVATGHTRAVRRPAPARRTGDPVTMGVEQASSIESTATTEPGPLLGVQRQPAARGDRPEDVERADVGHFVVVVLRWWVVILAGTIFIVGTAVALLRLTTPPYRAEIVLVFDQPVSGGLSGQQGLAATQTIISLLPTYASIATSDKILTDAASAAGVQATLEQLRVRVTALPVPETLTLRVSGEDANPQVAEKLTTAVSQTFAKQLDDRQAASGIPADRRSTVATLSTRTASRATRAETRTVILAALLGLTVTVALAFLLEYIRPAGRELSA